MKAVVTGMIATFPVGGVAWDYGQYALGFEQLGFDVYYLEDTGCPTYDPRKHDYGSDDVYGVEFLQRSLASLSPTLSHRWHFRGVDDSCHGMDEDAIAEVCATADLFVNVSGGTLLRPAYRACRRKILIDTDPGWNHYVIFPRWDKRSAEDALMGWRAHDWYFTYAECLENPACRLPTLGQSWHATRPPVVLSCWGAEPPGRKWTTVMAWNNFRKPVEYGGASYGAKEMEFPVIEDLPGRVTAELELAIGSDAAPRQRWQDLGWSVLDAHRVTETLEGYRHYVQQSRGELSVSKNIYVATHSGWFSCRSVCYLAAGRPVVLQDTGFSEYLATGEGLLVFRDGEEAARAITAVENDYERHQAAARRLAETEFESEFVLKTMLETIF